MINHYSSNNNNNKKKWCEPSSQSWFALELVCTGKKTAALLLFSQILLPFNAVGMILHRSGRSGVSKGSHFQTWKTTDRNRQTSLCSAPAVSLMCIASTSFLLHVTLRLLTFKNVSEKTEHMKSGKVLKRSGFFPFNEERSRTREDVSDVQHKKRTNDTLLIFITVARDQIWKERNGIQINQNRKRPCFTDMTNYGAVKQPNQKHSAGGICCTTH